MRLQKGLLKKISNLTNISNVLICDYAATRRRPGRQRSIELEEACSKIGLNVPKELWMFGISEEIKEALSTPIVQTDRKEEV